MFVAGAILYFNFKPYPRTIYYGWPFSAYDPWEMGEMENRVMVRVTSEPHWIAFGAVADAGAAVVILSMIWTVSEYLIRRREGREL